MTEKKQVAATLANILDNNFMKDILNRETPPFILADKAQQWWSWDLFSRSPGPALKDGVFVGTDLDLACFLMTLSDRNAIINIPKYKSMKPTTIREGERVISNENRHGPIIGLVSNQELFSFSIRIKDANVINENEVGAYRTFSVTDPSGEWYKGWESIQWDPSLKENAFLSDKNLWAGHTIVFKNFVHPNRWTSFYGQYYFMTKALIDRLTEQAKDMNIQIKKMLSSGVEYPSEGKDAQKEWPKTETAEGKSVKFKAMEVEIDLPEVNNEFPIYKSNTDNLIQLTKDRKKLVYTIIPNLRFATRCTELAFFKHANNTETSDERLPAWLGGGVKWERNYKQKGKKKIWDRLKIMQPGVGQTSVSIRKRIIEKTETMAIDYKEK